MAPIPESHRDLLDSCQVVTLATVGSDVFPQVTAVWFALDGNGAPLMSLNTARQKVRNLERRPECSLLFVDPENPYRTLEIRARARIQSAPTMRWRG
jgi:PPOX class probable F420-dependent enzyme